MDRGHSPYPVALRLIHWLTAGLIAVQLGLVGVNALIYEDAPVWSEALVQGHIWIGLIILSATLARVGLRLVYASPTLNCGNLALHERLASIMHYMMYGLIFAVTITGFLKLAWLGYQFELFGVVVLPELDLAPQAAITAQQIHTIAAYVLAALAAGHAIIALQHGRLLGISVLWKMKL